MLLAITGASGAGKSTLLNILGGLDHSTAGTLEIGGQRVETMGERERCRLRAERLGFVFQFHHLLEDFTALENVLMPVFGAHTWIGASFRDRACALLERVGLSNRMSFPASKLSGGQKQRVAVARALIMKPDLILADEPTGNLDRASSDEVLRLLRELSVDEGIAFLISTHDESIARRCDRILSMEDGRLRGALRES